MAGRDLYGRTLGEFVLREQIGEGGHGAVYRGEQPALKRDVVVKVLHERRRDDASERRFLREARLASRLDHPYAAHVYASGSEDEDGLLWIAMERVHGVTLARWLEIYEAMPELRVQPWPALDQVVQRALAKHPQARYRTVLDMASELRVALRATKREQLRSSAQQWEDEDRAPDLLWGRDMLAELERQVCPEDLSELEVSFVADSARRARRIRWIRRLLGAAGIFVVLGVFLYRAEMRARVAEQQAELQTRLAQEHTRSAQQVTEATITQSELEQGRSALLHGEFEASLHLGLAYQRGDHSPSTAFMYARALQPRLAEQARFVSSSGRMWSAAFSPDGRQIVTTDDQGVQILRVLSSVDLTRIGGGAGGDAIAMLETGRRACTPAPVAPPAG